MKNLIEGALICAVALMFVFVASFLITIGELRAYDYYEAELLELIQ